MTRGRIVVLIVLGYIALHLAGLDSAAVALLQAAPALTSPAVVDPPPPSPVASPDDGGSPISADTDG